MNTENLELPLATNFTENFAEEVLSAIAENEVISTEAEQIESQEMYVLFDELKEKYEGGSLINEILEIKKYLPIMYKQVMINGIIESATDIDHNNMTKINYCNLELFKSIRIIEFMTNYQFDPETIIEEYDWMAEHGIIESIYNYIGCYELANITKLLDRELDQIMKVDNSIESVISSHLYLLQDQIETLIGKIPDMDKSFIEKLVTKATKAISKFKVEDVKLIKELSDFSKGIGK